MMHWMTQHLLLLVAGVVAGAVNTLSGGGSLLTLPALMAVGLTPAQANASNRISVLLQSVTAARQMHRAFPYPVPLTLGLAAPAAVASAVGAGVSLALSAQALRVALGVALLVGLGLSLLSPRRLLDAQAEVAPPARPGLVVGLVVVGFYTGMLQAGVGVLYTLALCGLGRWDLTRASGAKSLIILVCTVPALGMFWHHDLIRWGPAVTLSVGGALGAVIAARYVARLQNARGLLLGLVGASVLVSAAYLIWA
jgi:uncharacterized membrane protein YfcA